MTTIAIQSLKSQGMGRDAIYQIAAGGAGLFGVAFYGHKGTKTQKARLSRIWNRIDQSFS